MLLGGGGVSRGAAACVALVARMQFYALTGPIAAPLSKEYRDTNDMLSWWVMSAPRTLSLKLLRLKHAMDVYCVPLE